MVTNEVQGVDGLSNEPILVPVGGTTYKAARLSMELMSRIGARWREERINATLSSKRVMMMAPTAHIEFISNMAAKRFDVQDLLRDLDLRRICVQVSCELHDPKFSAGRLSVELCSQLCNEILIGSELLQRPDPSDNGRQADPTETASPPTGERSSETSARAAT